MRFTIIGGTGFIGPYLVRQLVGEGHHVTVYHRGEHEADLPEGVRHIRSPWAAIPVVEFPPELLDPPPDVVVHMIAMGERDARAAVEAFYQHASRLVVLSSGDVYRAYGRLTGLEPGPPDPMPVSEEAPLRSVLYPYRKNAGSPRAWEYDYEKILVEREAMRPCAPPCTILRLPKVYGPGGNADLATVHAFRGQPRWRWTHGYVENVAAAIRLAALHPRAAGHIYNIGEEPTPSVEERLAHLPPPRKTPDEVTGLNFAQDLVYDTTRIRRELAFAEVVPYPEGLRRTLDWCQARA